MRSNVCRAISSATSTCPRSSAIGPMMRRSKRTKIACSMHVSPARWPWNSTRVFSIARTAKKKKRNTSSQTRASYVRQKNAASGSPSVRTPTVQKIKATHSNSCSRFSISSKSTNSCSRSAAGSCASPCASSRNPNRRHPSRRPRPNRSNPFAKRARANRQKSVPPPRRRPNPKRRRNVGRQRRSPSRRHLRTTRMRVHRPPPNQVRMRKHRPQNRPPKPRNLPPKTHRATVLASSARRSKRSRKLPSTSWKQPRRPSPNPHPRSRLRLRKRPQHQRPLR